jgi:outer membrane protein insertion porin family/translocation and assembly module TamA
MYQGQRTDGLEAERATFPELLTTLDLRDDPVHTRQGLYVSNSIQFAHAGLSGTLYDLRLRPEARFYLPLGRAKRVVLALRTGFGFLFPQNYGDTLERESELPPDSPELIRDQHKVLLRAFYSGGPNSNRGYPLRGVGPQGPIFFLVPTSFDCTIPTDENGEPNPEDLPLGCIRPRGGLTLWEASLELRFEITGPLGAVLFADASDVTRTVGEIGLQSPHLSVGPGLRYFSPIGPIRADLGFRIPGFQVIGVRGSEIPREEGQAGTILGMPVAVHLAIGEAF